MIYWRFGLSVLVSASLIAADLQFQAFGGLREQMSVILTPFHYSAELPSRAVSATKDYFGDRDQLLAEKQEMEDKLTLQELRISSLDFFVTQNAGLRALLNLKESLPGKWLAADIRPNASQIREHRIYLGRGEEDGITPGMTVVDENGIIGQIVRVYADYCEVNLLTSPQQWIAARIRRTGNLAIVRGNGDSLEIYSMHADSDLREGDKLVADGGAFPPGHAVGEISEITRGVRYLNASAKPASGFYDRRTLLIYMADLSASSQ